MRYRFKTLRVPDNAAQVATLDADGRMLDATGAATAPQTIVIKPNNAAAIQTVNLSTLDFPTGTRVVVEPTSNPATYAVTITPKGSFVGPTGSAIQQCVIDTSGGFAICDMVGGVTVLSVYKGADLTT